MRARERERQLGRLGPARAGSGPVRTVAWVPGPAGLGTDDSGPEMTRAGMAVRIDREIEQVGFRLVLCELAHECG